MGPPSLRHALLWIAAFWLLALAWNFGPIGFAPSLLAIPLAAMLGQRYGRRALWLVALGGLALLPPSVSYGWLTKIAALDVYAVALAVCALAADERPLAERLPRFPGAAVLAAALVLLPLVFSPWGTDFGGRDEWRIGLAFSFVAIFYFVLFLLGWSGFSSRWTVAALALGTAAGIWLETVVPPDGRALLGGPAAELPLFGLTATHYLWWDYRLDTSAAFLTGVGWFAGGRLWGRMLRTRAQPIASPYAYALVIGLVALALGSMLNRELIGALGFDPRALPRYAILLGSGLALPLAGLAGGLLLGKRGVLVAAAAVVLFWGLTALLIGGLSLAAHELFVVAGFGLMGAALRERALGTESAWPVRRWALGAALCVLALGFVAEAGSPAGLALRLLALAAAGAAALFARWLRARLGGMFKFSGEAWMVVLAAGLVAALLAGQAATMGTLLAAVSEDFAESWEEIYRAEDAAVVVAGALVLLGVLAAVLELLIRNLRAVLEDIASWTRAAALGRLAASALWPRLAAGARWARTAAFVLAALPFLAAAAYALYPEGGIVAAARALFESRGNARDAREAARGGPKTAANPLLWQAALEAVKEFPLVESDPANGRLVTGWKSDPGAPGMRTKMTLHVGRQMQRNELGVELVRQKRGPLGIWVQQGTYWDSKARKFAGSDVAPETERVRKELFARALELEKGM